MDEKYFQERIGLAVRPETLRTADNLVKHYPQFWESRSHVFRSAVHWLDRCVRDGTFKVMKNNEEVISDVD